jgi:predicted nucleic acid-binding protein
MRVYLDSCSFNRPFDDQSQLRIRLESEAKLEVQERIRSGRVELIWSYMMDFENSENPFKERRTRIEDWRKLATAIVESDPLIVTRAAEIHSNGLKPKDSLHLACAEKAACDRFITTDDRMLKRRLLLLPMEIISPIDFVIELP